MGLEHLLTELFVASRLHGVALESVGVGVHVMVLGEHVRDWEEGGCDSEHDADNNLLIARLVLSKVGDVLSDIVGHLRSGRGSSIVILDHAIMELWGHSDNHMIVVGVEVTTLGHIKTERRRVVVASQQVVWVVDQTWLGSTSLGQIGRPHTHVGVLRLMDGHIWRPDSVMDLTLTEVPLLEEVTAVLLMSWVNLGKVDHCLLEFHLRETLVHEEIVLLVNSTVAALASTGEDLEAATETKKEKALILSYNK